MPRSKFIAVSLALALAAPLGVAAAPPAGAATLTSVTFTGHGYGHGRGMGQYGAYGYALEGQSAAWILAHYYGGTTPAAAPAGQTVTVRLNELDTATSVPVSAVGGATVTAAWQGGSTSGQTVTVARSGSGLTVNAVAVNGDVTLTAPNPLTAGLPGGGSRSYHGSLVVKASVTQVWNVVGLDDYAAGVVPAEEPASWGTNGIAALEAQAVAARSYALAYGPVICDTPTCQVYSGDQDVPGDPAYDPTYTHYADQAVQATAGQVLDGANGQPVLAEFSSSTGGYTAGGAFPAVPDAGDGDPRAGNPNHDWSTTVSASTIQAVWPQIGTLEGVAVTARNGLGDFGGRATSVTVSGTRGQVQVSGDTLQYDLGLLSDWFEVSGTSGGTDGYWVLSADGAVHPFGGAPGYGSIAGTHINAPVVAMAPTADQQGYWEVAGDGGIFSYGDAAFHGSTGSMHLNQPIVGMAATRDGGGYWLVAADGGIFAFGDAGFYGSAGSAHLAQPVVGMVPAPDGKGYTLVARDGGVFCYGSAQYLGSLPGEGVSDTVVALAPTADGGGYEVLGATGHVHPFGDAPFDGNLTGTSAAVDIFGHKA